MSEVKEKPKTAREIYAEKKQETAERFLNECPVQDGEKLFDLVSPSGMEWQVRRPNLKLFLDAGILPANLASKLYLASKQSAEERSEVIKTLSYRETLQSIEFNAAMIRYICVNPRVVDIPVADNEISYDMVTQGDYEFLTEWSRKGGEQAAGLENFPGKRSVGSVAGATGTGNGKTRKRKARSK